MGLAEHMGTLVVTEMMTLDGVAQAPTGPDEDRDAAFAYGGWNLPHMSPESGAAIFNQARTMDALLLGRKTYDVFASYWPTAPEEIPYTALLNNIPKYVVSRAAPRPLTWHGSELLEGDLAESINALKARHDEIHVIGSTDLVQSLLRDGLVDRLNLWQCPVVLGVGKRVFGDGTIPASLRLTDSVIHTTGVLQLTYEFVGVPDRHDVDVSRPYSR